MISMKYLLLLSLLCTVITAREILPVIEKTDFIRIIKDEESAQLQTANTTYSKGKISVTLIGAIHIADQTYYEALNDEFKKYDTLIYEMIGGENIKQLQLKNRPKENEHFLSKIYGKGADFLDLTSQTDHIDYQAKNFIHGDLTFQEYQALQKERGESLVGIAVKSTLADQKQPQINHLKLIKGLLTNQPNLIKRELMRVLEVADDDLSEILGESVIITDRNAKCLKVLSQEIKKGRKNIGIFYGSAHFTEMETSLLEMGFKKSKQAWLTAWHVPMK